MQRTRFTLKLDPAALAVIERMAGTERLSRTEVIHRAIGIMDAIDRRPAGHYVGLSAERESLSQVLVGAR